MALLGYIGGAYHKLYRRHVPGTVLERPEAVSINPLYMLRGVECDEYFKKAAAKEDKFLVPRCPPVVNPAAGHAPHARGLDLIRVRHA